MKFRTSLIIKSLTLSTSCFSLLCLQRKSCRHVNSNSTGAKQVSLTCHTSPPLPWCPCLPRHQVFGLLLHQQTSHLLQRQNSKFLPSCKHHLQKIVLCRCPVRVLLPHLPQDALSTFDTTVAMELGTYKGIAQVNGHTLLQMMEAT
jgi:hypothetical protein